MQYRYLHHFSSSFYLFAYYMQKPQCMWWLLWFINQNIEIKNKKSVSNIIISGLKETIIIIIMSCWPSLATFPFRSSPLAGLLDYIPYPHIVAEYMFVLVFLLLHGHMWGSIRVYHLWVRFCFSCSVLHVWFV